LFLTRSMVVFACSLEYSTAKVASVQFHSSLYLSFYRNPIIDTLCDSVLSSVKTFAFVMKE